MTEYPTFYPTESPTNTPSEYPTFMPTTIPTEAPTETPTITPTENPTHTETSVPTETPTEQPSSEAPTFGTVGSCAPFTANNTNSATANYALCGIYACANTTLVIGDCGCGTGKYFCNTLLFHQPLHHNLTMYSSNYVLI